MQLLLSPTVIKRLRRELRRAGSREIGGLLMGEHLGDERFRIVEISVQRAGGSRACFIRHPTQHRAQLDRFFERTGHDYARYNYLGEWHSHPSFAPIPSATDAQTMQSLIHDPATGAEFIVLLIATLSGTSMGVSATAFAANVAPKSVAVVIESGSVERVIG